MKSTHKIYELSLPSMILCRDDLEEEYEDCTDEQFKAISSSLDTLLMNSWGDYLEEAIRIVFEN
jgi:hypothetical protein